MNRKEIKAKAKEFGFNNKWNFWKVPLLIMSIGLLISLILGVLSIIFDFEISDENFFFNIISTIIELGLLPLGVGLAQYYIKLVRGEKVNLKETILSKYKKEYMWKIIGITIYSNLIISLFALLFVIPGIIYALKYAMLTFLLAEATSEELHTKNMLQKSNELMDGYKADYFSFQLSFLGWIFLSVLTFGILYIWILPYMVTARIMYYEELKKIKAKN